MDNEKGRIIVTIQQSKTDAAAIGTDAHISLLIMKLLTSRRFFPPI